MLEQNVDLQSSEDERLRRTGYLYSAADALQPPPQHQWCVQHLFAQPSFNMLVGDPGSKKTLAAIDLAVCVAFGKPWLGHSVSQGPVLFVDEQTGLHQLWARLNAALHAHGSGADVPLHYVSLAGCRLHDKESADSFITRVRSLKARLIILDSFSNLLLGGGESSLARVQPVLFSLRRIAEVCQAAVLVTHHTNSRGFFRGSSAISAAVDLMLAIESEPASEIISLRTLKSRFPAPAPMRAKAVFETAPDGSLRFHLAEQQLEFNIGPSSLEDLIPFPQGTIEFSLMYDIEYHGQVTFDELRIRHMGPAEGSIRNALQELLKAGLIARADGGGRGKKAVYSLAKLAGKEVLTNGESRTG